ncbi:scaffoldin, partial [Neocallimastix sp. 'constans']
MVNFKYFCLPFLVGLLIRTNGEGLLKREIGDACSFKNNGTNCIDGYYLLNEDEEIVQTEAEGVQIIYYDSGTNSKSEVDNIGIYINAWNSNTYIQCYKNQNETVYSVIAKPTLTECNDENTGKLFIDNEEPYLCLGKIGESKTFASLQLNSNVTVSNNFLIRNSYQNVFSFNDSTDYYVISHPDQYSIQFNDTINEIDTCADMSGLLINRKEDFCSNESSGRYYNCEDGFCSQWTQNTYEPDPVKIIIPPSEDCSMTVSSISCSVKSCGTKYAENQFVTSSGEIISNDEKNGFLISYDVANSNCTVTKTTSQGYYINLDKSSSSTYPLISCATTGCKLAKAAASTENPLVYYLSAENSIIKCEHVEEETTCTVEDTTQETYVNADNPLSLIYCEEKITIPNAILNNRNTVGSTKYATCVLKTATAGNYYPVKSKTGGPLIKCTSELCTEQEGSEGIFIDGNITGTSKSNIINCSTKDNCVSMEGKNYYIDGSITSDFGLIYCESSKCSPVTGKKRYAYISGDVNNRSLILCNDKCEETDATADSGNVNYYMNGADNSNVSPVITSVTVGNNTYWDAKSVLNQYSVFVNGNGDNSDKTKFAVIYCSSKNVCSEKDASSLQYKFINIPDKKLIEYDEVSTSWIEVSVSSNFAAGDLVTKAYLVNPENNEILTTNSVSSPRLFTCVANSTLVSLCSEPSSPITYYVSANDNKLIQYKNSVKSFELNPAVGYYIHTSNVIECSGTSVTCSKYDQSNITGCNASNANKITNSLELCLSDSSNAGTYKSLSLPMTAEKYIFNNKLYSVQRNEIAVVTPSTESEYYLTDKTLGKIQSSATEGTLYRCSKTGSSCTKITANGYYPNSDSKTYSTYPIIYCENGTCEGRKAGTSDVYCLNKSENAIYVYDGGCSSTKTPYKLTHKTGYYLNNESKELYQCTAGGSCGIYEASSGYYLSQDVSKPLVQCFNSLGVVKCVYIATPIEGYYISEGNSLVYCDSNKSCGIFTGTINGWFISGESNYALTYCNGVSCTSYSDPKNGWYLNGSKNSNKLLITCATSNNKVTCTESTIKNAGYYINAGVNMDTKILINCSSSSCNYENTAIQKDTYLLNGDDRQLIYCLSSGSCTTVAPSGMGWYLTLDDNSLIGCSENKICQLYSTSGILKPGYYINGDSKTYYYPLIIHDGSKFVLSDDSLASGWYVNADDIIAKSSKRIIKCTDANTCVLKDAKTAECSKSIYGEFTSFYGGLSWCTIDDTYIPLEESSTDSVVRFIRNDFIPGVNLPDSKKEAYVLIDVENNLFVPKVVDGYVYNSKTGLFFCPKSSYGICTKKIIDNGLYVFHDTANPTIYSCSKTNETCDEIKGSDATTSNIYINGSKEIMLSASLKSDANLSERMSDFTIDYLYALKNDPEGTFPFPGIESRYFMAYINKYSIILEKEITESLCKSDSANASEGDENKLCLNSEYKIYKEKSYTAVSGNEIDVDFNNHVGTIEYDYDTNHGYYSYENCNIKCELKTYYIPIDVEEDGKDDYKYECKIGGICMKLNIAPEPITSFGLSDDGVLKATKVESGEGDYEEEIKEGSYLMDSTHMIDCNKDGICQKTELDTELLDVVNSAFYFKFRGKTIPANKKRSKFVFGPRPRSLNKMGKRDTIDYSTVLELTHVSYSSSDETRNIFIDKEDYMVTSDSKATIATGFTCISGNCEEIKNCYITSYYLNTAQEGSNINSIIKCTNLDGEDTFTPIGAVEGNIYANAAATSVEDALIICTKDNCYTSAASEVNGLPTCKSTADGKGVYIDSISGRYIRADTGKELLPEQHCIFNGKIYNGDGDINNSSEDDLIVYLFDAAFKSIDDYTKIKGNQVYSSMYYCKNISNNYQCIQTYGYIVNSNNAYISCSKTGCNYITDVLKSECSLVGAGSLINNESQYKLCIDEVTSNAKQVSGVVTGLYYNIEINNNNIFPEVNLGDQIIVGTYKNVAFTLIEDGYLLIGNNNELINGTGKEGNIYECLSKTKNCEKVIKPSIGYYKTSFSINPIVVYEENGSIKKEINANTIDSINLEFSEDNTVSYKFIENDFAKKTLEVIAKIYQYKINALVTDNYVLLYTDDSKGIYRLVDAGETSDNMYSCSSTSGRCAPTTLKPGLYVSGVDSYKLIKCTESTCSVVKELGKNCGGVGEMIYSENAYNFCVNKSKKIPITSSAGLNYELGTSSLFPSGYDYVTVTINSVIGIGKKSASTDLTILPACHTGSYPSSNSKCKKDSSTSVDFCYVGSDKIYYSKKVTEGNTTTWKCEIYKYSEHTSQSVDGHGDVLIFNGGKRVGTKQTFNDEEEITSEVDSTKITQMYYCTGDTCRITTGYFKSGSNYYKCDYIGCKEDTGSSSEVDGSHKNGEGIYHGGSEITVPSSSNNYYYMSGNNEFPGAESNTAVLVEVGKSTINNNISYYVIFRGEGYYLISSTKSMLTEDGFGSTLTKRNTVYNSNLDRRSDENGLYYCTSSNLDCIVVSTPGNGYYLNSGGSINSVNKGLIVCKNNSCSIGTSDEVKFGISCNATYTGYATLDDKRKIYRVCISKAQSETFTNSVSTIKYYYISLGAGHQFGDVSIDTTDANAKSTANIFVSFGNRKIIQYEDLGYMLYGSSKDVLENTGQRGTLYYCNNENYLLSNQDIKTVQCSEVSAFKNGFYFSDHFDDNRYIKCESSCTIAVAPITNECQSSGSLIYNNNQFKLCQEEGKQVAIRSLGENSSYEVMMNIGSSKEFPGIKEDNTNIIAEVNPYYVVMKKLDSYVVVDPSNNHIEQGTTSGDLYKCESSGVCEQILLPEDNWYLKNNSTGSAIELIKCENGSECSIQQTIVDGFYVSHDKTLPIIQCIQPGIVLDGVVNGEEKVICKNRGYKDGWFRNAAINLYGNLISDKPLIKCNDEDGCVEKEIGDRNGYYINAGSNSIYGYDKLTNATIYPIMTCDISSCKDYVNEIAKTCSKGGELIYSSNNYKLCKSATESVDFSKLTSTTYQIVQVANSGDFPDATSGLILVRLSKYEAIQEKNENEEYVLKDRLMYKCQLGTCILLTDNDGIIVYEKLTSNLYTGSCSKGNCSWTLYNKEEVVFIDSEHKLVLSNVEDENNNLKKQTPAYIYRCRKNENKSLFCYELYNEVKFVSTDGFFYNANYKTNGKIVNTLYEYSNSEWSLVDDNVKICNVLTYKKNVCYIDYNNEIYTNDEEYDSSDRSSNYKINAGELCKTNNGRYYFAFNEINTGIDNINCAALPTDNSISYYEVKTDKYSRNIYTVDKYGAFKIENKNYINSLTNYITSEVDGINGIWIDSDPININKFAITCRNGSCVRETLPVCTYDIKSKKCKLASGSINAGMTCISEEGKIYLALSKVSNSVEGGCVPHEIKYHLSDSEKTKYERNESENYYIIDGKMYVIMNNNKVYLKGEGIYILDDANNYVDIKNYGNIPMDITETSQYHLYICNEQGCNRKTSCSFENEFEYIFDSRRADVIKCDPLTNTITRITKEGYYINTPWQDLIKCYNDGTCKEINSKIGMEGYYIDTGNEGKIIECRRDGNKFSCSSDEMIKCKFKESVSGSKFSESEGTCVSDVDLPRNSYCFYSVKDKIIGDIKKLIYIENFIKAGNTGECVAGIETDRYYKYKKSKFMGKEEHNDLIKVSKNSIVSIYENTVGYYLITTKDGSGMTENLPLRRTRLYKCVNSNCSEIRNPKYNEIYINKASESKMLVRLNGKYWNIIDCYCAIESTNISKCKFNNKNTKSKGNLMYTVKNENVTIRAITNDVNEKATYENHQELLKKTYLKNDGNLYLFNDNKQIFNYQNDNGYYVFNEPEYYDGTTDKKLYNMTPFKSTVNTTISDNEIYIVDNTISESSLGFGIEGYFWNKADVDNEGIIIQSMIVPDKYNEVETINNNVRNVKRELGSTTNVIKAVLNKCTSIKRNICVNTQENQTIVKGSPCIITDGDYKGLYIATSEIRTSSGTTNCIRYDVGIVNQCIYNNGKCSPYNEDVTLEAGSKCIQIGGENAGIYLLGSNGATKNSPGYCSDVNSTEIKSYQYIKERIEAIGQPIEKMILTIGMNSIVPFKHDYKNENIESGTYFVYDDNKLPFESSTFKSANAYNCSIQYEYSENGDVAANGYACNVLNGANKYYYDRKNKKVLFASNNKWKKETAEGYYFFNEFDRAATVTVTTDGNEEIDDDIKLRQGIVRNTGYYLNSAVTDKPVVISYDNSEYGVYEIANNDLHYCTVNKDMTCKSNNNDDKISSEDICYDSNSKKLYIVEEIITMKGEEQVTTTKCYTGTFSTMKYAYMNYKLYQLNGLSVQEVGSGYYVLNEEKEAFSSLYPETPYQIIHCTEDNYCTEINEDINLSQDVIINKAGEGENYFLRYYKNPEKFMNNNMNGCCYLDNDGILPTEEGASYGEHSCYRSGICINYAYASHNILSKDGNYYVDSRITYNSENDCISYNGSCYEEGKRKFIFYGGYLYIHEKECLSNAGKGLYLIKDGLPFDSDEWTSLSGTSEVCYYNGNGTCDNDELNTYKKHKYILNSAVEGKSIVSYDTELDSWRTVKEDGVYIFFEDNFEHYNAYSIDAQDRREYIVYQIKNGKLRDVTNEFKNTGFYIQEELFVEKTREGWEDGEKIIENVNVVGNHKCTAIETGELIELNEFCYSDSKGMCVAKTDINDLTININNCMFNDEENSYYYFINDGLYQVNRRTYQLIKENGLYIINSENKEYEDSIENEAKSYLCENGKCSLEKELDSQYYLNIASQSMGKSVILYYDSKSKLWKKTKKDGLYFFNENGYPVGEDENPEYKFSVSDNGSTIKNINGIGKYISKSNPEQIFIIHYNSDGWNSTVAIANCDVSDDGTVTSSVSLKGGDICSGSNGKFMLIKGINKKAKREDENTTIEYNSVILEGKDGEEKYYYLPDDNKLVYMNENHVNEVTGKYSIIIDNDTSLPLNDEDKRNCSLYQCEIKKGCLLVDPSTLVEGKRYINDLSDDKKLVKYMGNEEWIIEKEIGYYFFDKNMNPVGLNGVPSEAYEIYKENGFIKQKSIKDSTIVGFYFNKANSNKVLLNNNNKYWSKGIEIHPSNVTEIEEGISCQTTNETITYAKGDYCYKSGIKQIFLLTDDAVYGNEKENCVFGTNDEPKYIISDVIGRVLNSVNIESHLIELTNNAIRLAKPGYYILNQDGNVINNNDDEETEMHIYSCNESECVEVNVEENDIFLSNGSIYKIGEENKLKMVEQDGYYFFDSDGKVCSESDDKVTTIVEIPKVSEGEKTEIGIIDLDVMEVGAYVNMANIKSVGVYDGKDWTVASIPCTYVKESSSCVNDDIELNIGSYCIADGKMHIIYDIVDETEVKKCIPGNDEKPIYFNANGQLMIVKERSISIVDEKGYYAIDGMTYEALSTDTSKSSKFIQCEYDGQCKSISPEVGNYLNKAPLDINIVQYNTGNVTEAVTSNNKCNIKEDNSCSGVDVELNAGDVCIAENAMYLVGDQGKCMKAEENVVNYKIINGKMFMLSEDAVTQKMDGYYFINGQDHAIINKEDYAKSDTKGYICSNKGDCYELKPYGVKYYPDYTTMKNGVFTVVKYDEELKSKRSEGENSGYSINSEEGIIKMDDGSYVICEYNNSDEVSCNIINESGNYKTNDGELVVCSESDEGIVECSQALDGGYYVVDDMLMECEPDEENKELVCKEMDKEGYFLTETDDVLFQCVEKSIQTEIQEEDPNVSKIGKLKGREEGENVEEEGENKIESTSTVVLPTSTVVEESTPTPLDVMCNVVVCNEEAEIKEIFLSNESDVKIYVCKTINSSTGEEEEDNKFDNMKWVPSSECESGNYVKEGEYYICEEEKNKLDENNVEKPNDEHTPTTTKGNAMPATDKEKTTTTTTKQEATTTTSTKKSTTSPSSTTVAPSGASSIHKSFSSFYIYLVIIVFTIF